jgi:hypothetical protein
MQDIFSSQRDVYSSQSFLEIASRSVCVRLMRDSVSEPLSMIFIFNKLIVKMGNCNFKSEKAEEEVDKNMMSKNIYDMQYIIGRGGFGKVWLSCLI